MSERANIIYCYMCGEKIENCICNRWNVNRPPSNPKLETLDYILLTLTGSIALSLGATTAIEWQNAKQQRLSRLSRPRRWR